MGIMRDLFGPGTWGTGGNLVAWVLCGALAAGWLHGKLKAQETLARLHHQEKMQQAADHHQEVMAQAEVQHEALKEHITATAAPCDDSGHRAGQ